MRAIEVQGSFGLENLRLVERRGATLGPRQVRVRVKAVSLNYRDLLMVTGQYNPKQKLPLVPASDGTGVVLEVGPEVTRFQPGDRVAASFAQSWIGGEPTREKLAGTLGGPLDGMLAEEVVLDQDGWVAVPTHLSDEQAACLPCAAVTAWSALTQGNLRAGDTLLTQGTGGVSLFALQLGKLLGARVLITSSSDEKLARARALGADETINYRSTPEWGKVARELTGKAGVDHVIEVGGAETLAQSLRAVRAGGHVSLIGVLSGNKAELSLLPILMQNVRVQGVLVGSREVFEAMNRAVALHRLVPVVDRVFALEEARAAFEHLASGTHFGKVVIRLG